MKLPSHVPIFIDPNKIKKIERHLLKLGFYDTFLQVIYPGVVLGRVQTIEFEGMTTEFHFRCFKNGKIEAEFEPQRIKSMKDHLTRKSYSGHEYVIQILQELNIEYEIDSDLQYIYNKMVPKEFTYQRFRWMHWLFYLCLIVSPIGLAWRFKEKITCKLS